MSALPTVRFARAGDPPAPDAEWVVFGEPAQLPPAELIARRVARAGPADLVLLVPGPRRRRLVDLMAEPDTVLPSRAVPVFPAHALRDHDLRLDPQLDTDLAATLLAARHLDTLPRPLVAIAGVPSAAQPQPRWHHLTRYSVLPSRYEALLAESRTRRGSVPRWLQGLVAGQVFALLCEDAGLSTVTGALDTQTVDTFHRALRGIRRHLDDAVVTAVPGAEITDELRAAVLLGTADADAHSRPVQRADPGRDLARVSYLFTGARPVEQLLLDGTPIDAQHHKLRTVDVVGRPLLAERIMWVPLGARLTLEGGTEIDVRATRPESRVERYVRIAAENRAIAKRVVGDARIRARARTQAARERYAAAWLLMDRGDSAQDNAEHLYRYLRAEAPDVNAWFVLSRTSSDWERLSAEGFRLLDLGSDEYFTALLHCVHLVSSQVDGYVINPFRKHRLGAKRWRFTFLQHGVLRHDLSRWLNPKPIDLFVTSTPDEQRAVVADGTPYVFTDLETRMTGLARHDRLLRLAEAEPERTALLIMPTWRDQLLTDQTHDTFRTLLDDFWGTDYALAWRRLLESDSLRELCDSHGWQVTFVPHPNMQDYLATANLPDHVSSLRYKDIDVQRVLARAVAVVTDYSSLANEAGYIHRPVVYYQFDRDAFWGGGHFHRPGQWRYERDGFGPVTETVEDAVAALTRIAAVGGPEPEYAERIERGFPLRDGRCCERTVTEIRRLGPLR